MLSYVIATARATLGPQQGVKSNCPGLREILISIAKYLAPPQPLSFSTPPPKSAHTQL